MDEGLLALLRAVDKLGVATLPELEVRLSGAWLEALDRAEEAGLVHLPQIRRGGEWVYALTQRGHQVLAENPA